VQKEEPLTCLGKRGSLALTVAWDAMKETKCGENVPGHLSEEKVVS